MVAKDIVCHFCNKSLPICPTGYAHDADLNLICTHCSKPLFGVTKEADDQIKAHYYGRYHYSAAKKESLPIRLIGSDPDVPVAECCDEENYLFC